MEYSDQSLYVSDLATLDGVNYVIDDSTFKNCTIKGPAVLRLFNTTASGGGISIPGYDPETVLIVAEDDRNAVPVGSVAVRKCHFENCTFEAISFLAPAAEADRLRESFMSSVPQQ